MAYAGADLHKSFCQTIVCTKEGGLIKEGRIKTELRKKNIKYRERASIFMRKGKEKLRSLKNPVIDSYLAIYETRWILVEAARVHVQWCPENKITKHYQKIKRKRETNIAIIAGARKLLQVIYYMLKNKEEFRIEG